MIPFPELSAALDRWRIRNGLPVVPAEPIAPVTRAAAPPPPPPRAPAPPPPAWTAPAPAPAPVDDEVLEADEAMVDEPAPAHAEGDDFSYSFGGAAADPEPTATSVVAAPPADYGVASGTLGGGGDDAGDLVDAASGELEVGAHQAAARLPTMDAELDATDDMISEEDEEAMWAAARASAQMSAVGESTSTIEVDPDLDATVDGEEPRRG